MGKIKHIIKQIQTNQPINHLPFVIKLPANIKKIKGVIITTNSLEV